MAFTVKVDADAILVLKINLTYPGFMLLTIYSLFKKNTQIRLCSTENWLSFFCGTPLEEPSDPFLPVCLSTQKG